MQYDVDSPAAYMDALADDWRRVKVQILRGIIEKTAPGLEACISYKMLGFKDDQGVIFHLNAQKNHVSLYVGDAAKIDPSGELLAGLNLGKGCIRFTKTKAIPEDRMTQFIAKAVDMWQAGEDIGC
ncbi:MAG: DUF1801 domain-containing protein [Bacteroidota bacterium]